SQFSPYLVTPSAWNRRSDGSRTMSVRPGFGPGPPSTEVGLSASIVASGETLQLLFCGCDDLLRQVRIGLLESAGHGDASDHARNQSKCTPACRLLRDPLGNCMLSECGHLPKAVGKGRADRCVLPPDIRDAGRHQAAGCVILQMGLAEIGVEVGFERIGCGVAEV